MSQPPKSTIFAPAARCRALSGVVLSMPFDLEHGRTKGQSSISALPRLSFYLRDCGALVACTLRRCPFGGQREPNQSRAAALQMIDAVRAVLLPERSRELRLRRQPLNFGCALLHGTFSRLPVAVRPCQSSTIESAPVDAGLEQSPAIFSV